MELTGKCKEDFNDWICLTVAKCSKNICTFENFYRLNDAAKHGVFEEFFDSVGLVIDIDSEMVLENPFFDFTIDGKDGHDGNGKEYKTRLEVRDAAIEKANEIYNYL